MLSGGSHWSGGYWIVGVLQIALTVVLFLSLGLWKNRQNGAEAVPAETVAFFAGMFFLGMTAGRAWNGFLTVKFDDKTLIRMGMGIIALGVGAMLLPMGKAAALTGLLLVGLGCAPIYPCIIHSTPEHFGPERSQALIGVQMASAYVGTLLMTFMHERMLRKV